MAKIADDLKHEVFQDSNPQADLLTVGIDLEIHPINPETFAIPDGWQFRPTITADVFDITSGHGSGTDWILSLVESLRVIETQCANDPDLSLAVTVGGFRNLSWQGEKFDVDEWADYVLRITSANEHGLLCATGSLQAYQSIDRRYETLKNSPGLAVKGLTHAQLCEMGTGTGIWFDQDTITFRLFNWVGADNALVAIIMSMGIVQMASEDKRAKNYDLRKDARGGSFHEAVNCALLECCAAVSRYWSPLSIRHGHYRGFPTAGVGTFLAQIKKIARGNWRDWQKAEVDINMS